MPRIDAPALPTVSDLYPLYRPGTPRKQAALEVDDLIGIGRVQQLGGVRLAHQVGQAAARQRSAPAADRAVDLVSGASGAGQAGRPAAQHGRRQHRRHAADRARAHRYAGLGLHQHRPRRAGHLHREDQSRQPQPVPDARWLARLRDDADGDCRQGRRRAQRGAPAHAAWAGTAGLLSQPRRHAGRGLRGGAAVDRAQRRRHDHRRRHARRRRARHRRLHRAHAPVHRADAEHGDRRCRRPHRPDRAGPRAGARPRQPGRGAHAGAGLGRHLRLEGLPQVRGPAALHRSRLEALWGRPMRASCRAAIRTS